MEKPNILFLFADQFAYDAIGALNGVARTPHLDAMRQKSICFDTCYTTSPLCMPARASLATGLYPAELCIMDNFAAGLCADDETWMQRLRDNGYETSLFGKAHLHKFPSDMRQNELTKAHGYQIVDEMPGPRTYGNIGSSYYDHLETQGLLEIYREDMDKRYKGCVYDSSPTPLSIDDYADVFITERALEYLQSAPSERPWFCTVGFGGPHDPWDTPSEYVDGYANVDMPKPLKKPISKNPQRPCGVYDRILNGKYDPGLTEAICDMTPKDIEELRKSYYGHVTLIDEQIGRLLSCLEARGQLENTIVVFSADHGEQNGDYGLLFKQTFFETSVRVPLMIQYPARLQPQTVAAPVELMDLGPTLCTLTGVEPLQSNASSLLAADGSVHIEKDMVISQLFGETMVLCQNIKGVLNKDGEIYILFDMENDPQESCNLAACGTQIEQQLRRKLDTYVGVGRTVNA